MVDIIVYIFEGTRKDLDGHRYSSKFVPLVGDNIWVEGKLCKVESRAARFGSSTVELSVRLVCDFNKKSDRRE